MAVALLTTRVKAPNKDNWGKLNRVLKYVKGMKSLVLTLEVDKLRLVTWYVDASYVVDDYCKGQSGGMMIILPEAD